jgi:hypothetical protein
MSIVTDLIINSGIQYISIPINLRMAELNKVRISFSEKLLEQRAQGDIYELKEAYYWEEEEIFIDKSSINAEAFSRFGSLNPREINRNYILEINEEEIFSLTGKEALQICEGHWIPIPYFRIRQDVKVPFHHGPENWCRMNIQPHFDEEKNTSHVLVIAFDTSAGNDDYQYSRPRLSDANDNGSERFRCVTEHIHAPKFYTSESLWDWMFNIYWLDEKNASRHPQNLRHVAVFHTIIKTLEYVNAFPEIGLLSGENTIEVGLTLDIGNSRTCGLICEKSRPFDSLPFDFTSARKLQLRNLSRPHKVYEDPFEMQVAFSEEKFGNPASDLIDEVFNWPSLVRVGPEAVELTSIFESQDFQATMSSPKRYLWDKKSVKIPWIKVDKEGRLGYHDSVEIRNNALYGIAEHITSDGKLIKDNDKEFIIGATESRFSRSSIMMFAFYEIILHAVSQINNHEFRRDLGNSTYRRILKDIVITCPTAMTVQEQYTLRKAAVDAIYLIDLTLKDSVDFKNIKIEIHPGLPSLDLHNQDSNPWKFDEATCSQLAYLYGELIHKFGSNHKTFFDLKGKFRNGSSSKSINIASIDIGGGTTDLMICNYSYAKNSDVPYLTPVPLFWEGFSLAGDDIVKRIIERVVIPTIHLDLERKNGKNVVSVINELFGQNVGGQSAIDKIYRRQFANMIATPIVYKIFNHLINESESSCQFIMADVFDVFDEPESGLMKYINDKISNRTGIDNYNIKDVDFNINKASVNEGVKDVMSDVLKQLSFLVAQFDCDILLLSGRPSRLPIVTDIISSTLNFGMHIIVNLGDYRFGNWYPFANPSGYVNDPKSTVCVGALIAYLNKISRLPGLRFDLSQLDKISSTAKYLGVINYNQGIGNILSKDLIFSPDKIDGELNFYGEPISIGMKQLESENWIATSLYLFDFKDDDKKAQLCKSFQFPYKIKFNRIESTGEFFSRQDIEIEDQAGLPIDNFNFEFILKTSSTNSIHWKDSGSFITRIE